MPTWIEILVPTMAVLLTLAVAGTIWFGAREAADPKPGELACTTLVLMGVWAVVTVAFTLQFATVDGEPVNRTGWWLAIGWAIPIVVILAAFTRSSRVRAALWTRTALWRLASIEIGRNTGFIFLVLHSRGELPGVFAYPAAWGDAVIGISAFGAAAIAFARYDEVMRPGSPWRTTFLAWNVLGVIDMLMAVTLAFLPFPGPWQVIGGEPSTALFAELPLLLFVVFLVPTVTALHVLMIFVVLRPVVSDGAHQDTSVPFAKLAG